MNATQLHLFTDDAGIMEKFLAWKETPGARHILRDLYAMAAPYAARYNKTGLHVSIKLLWERERDRIATRKWRGERLGVRVEKVDGYRLNNNFTALIARHIEEHRTDWAGMFEKRERIEGRKQKRAVIVLPVERRKAGGE